MFDNSMKNKQLLVTGCLDDGGLYKIDLANIHLTVLMNNGDFRGIAKYRHRCNDCYIVLSNEYGILKLDRNFNIIQEKNKIEALDLHGAAIYNNQLYIVETAINAIGIYNLEDLSRIDEIRFSDINSDVLHVNDIYFSGKRLFVSMFSEIQNWRELRSNSGVIVEYSISKKEIIKHHFKQLNKPHSVICSNNKLYYCNTFEREVRKEGGVILHTEKYPRGLTAMNDTFFVGLSMSRNKKEQEGNAEVLIYNHSLQTSQHISVPCQEIYGLLLI